MNSENKIAYILGAIGVLSVAIVVGLIIFGGGSSPEQQSLGTVAKYSVQDENRPIAVLEKESIDWGEINLKDTIVSEVELKNTGKLALQITRMSTSCGCTAVQAIFPDGKQTKEYNMHKSSELVTIPAGTSIKLKITYRPFTMPVEGEVVREVYLETNDPINKSLKISAKAVVKK